MAWVKENQDLALLDDEFVVALLEQRQRELYARVISLTVDEEPIEYIEGKVTSGSINVDGNSSVRRSCSLSLIAEDVNITDYYWGLNTKFRLFIGLKNNLNNEFSPKDSIYPEIVWFPQGTYVISNFSTSLSVNSCTISISGKDKMCLLNGELGGLLYAQVDFGLEEELLTKFTKVDTSATGNIDTFWSGLYYKKGIYIPIEHDGNLENVNLVSIPSNTTEYGFVKKESGDFDEGTWYKEFGETVYKYFKYNYVYTVNEVGNYKLENNEYILISGDYDGTRYSRLLDEIRPTYGQEPATALYLDYYDGYTRVNKPSDMFIEGSFDADKINYYIPKNLTELNYYVLETSKTAIRDTYYHLIDLYRKEEEQTITKIPLKKIIVQAVHAFAKEPFHNIIINDVDDYGLEQTTYKGDKTIVAFREAHSNGDGEFKNLAFVDNFVNDSKILSSGIQYVNNNFYFTDGLKINNETKKVEPQTGIQPIGLDTLTEDSTGKAGDSDSIFLHNSSFVKERQDSKDTEYTLATFDYGEDLGYRITPLVYPDELITNLGDSLTSVLDKIKTMLGDFEYFYDVDGRFVFLRQKTYVNVSFDKFEETLDENYVNYNEANNKFSFNFEGNKLLTLITNTPVLTNLKNDYAIWGKRKGITGADIPIHARYAIDKKPTSYLSLRGILYYTDEALDSMYKSLIDSSQLKPSYVKDTASIPQWLCDLEGPDVTPQTSLWWNIYDWSEYYKFLTGAYPSLQLKYYTSGFLKAIVNENNVDLFPSTYLSRTHWAWSPHRQDCIDIETATGKVATLGLMHTTCGHLYSWFRQRGAELGTSIASFIYNPTLPTPEVIAADQTAAGIDPSGGLIDRIGESSEYVKKVDWREIIYQMALDYFAAGGSAEKPLDLYQIKEDANGNFTQEKSTYQLTEPDDLLVEIALRNPDEYPTGYTGYEQYYTDLQGFWRLLYNPDYHPEAIWTAGELKTTKKRNEDNGFYTIVKTWTDDKISDLKFDYYIKSSTTEGRLDNKKDTIRKHFPGVGSRLSEDILEKYTQYVNDDRAGWNTLVFDNPETLNFWFDFFEGDELGKYSTQLVGDRSKTVNDDKVNAIIFKEIPRIILYNKEEERNILLDDAFYEKSGYLWVFIPPSFNQYLNISYRSKSAKDKINEMLYLYGYCTENVSITALPIYHLQPNTRIYVLDLNTGINGEYIVTRISLPLTYSGTMSITANKAPERII